MAEVCVRPFRLGDETVFRELNEAWIRKYFKVESKDLYTFDSPLISIVEKGGAILIATLEEKAVGCCALLPLSEGAFEVAKMAVSEEYQGKRIGRRLLEDAIAMASRLGAARLYLETNHILEPAIALYRSVGFRDIDPSRVVPSPYARADVYMELLIEHSLQSTS